MKWVCLKKLGQLCSQFVKVIWKTVPWKMNHLLGQVLAFLWFDLFRIRRQVIFQNLEIAFPQMSLTQKKQIARQSMVSMCRSFFDVMKIPSLTDAWIEKNVVFEGLEIIEKIKQQKQGVLFLTLHLGSGDLGAAVVSRKIWPCSLITKRFKNQFLDQFWFGLRGASETQFIDAHSERNAFDIFGALKKNRAVIFVLDQFMGKPYGIQSQFFGVETGTAYGLALFALKTKKPVVPIYTYWDSTQKLHICWSEPVALSLDVSETYEQMTNQFNLALEKIIQQHPEHWMWVHRRWKKFE